MATFRPRAEVEQEMKDTIGLVPSFFDRFPEEALEKVHGPEHSALTMSLYQMAKIHRQMGDAAVCETLLRRVLAINENNPDARHGLAMLQIELARCLTALGRYAEAEAYLQPLTAGEQIDPVKDRAREALAELERARGERQAS